MKEFRIVIDSWMFSMLLLYIWWDDRLIFFYFSFKWTATLAIGIHPTKTWLSQLVDFKNAIWTWGHFITRTMHQSTNPSFSQSIWPRWASRQLLTLLIVQTLLPVTFGYSLCSEAVIMRHFRRWKRLWRRSLTFPLKRTSMGPCIGCENGTTSALQPEEITSKGTRVSCVYYQEKCPNKKSLETCLMVLVFSSVVWRVLSLTQNEEL